MNGLGSKYQDFLYQDLLATAFLKKIIAKSNVLTKKIKIVAIK